MSSLRRVVVVPLQSLSTAARLNTYPAVMQLIAHVRTPVIKCSGLPYFNQWRMIYNIKMSHNLLGLMTALQQLDTFLTGQVHATFKTSSLCIINFPIVLARYTTQANNFKTVVQYNLHKHW